MAKIGFIGTGTMGTPMVRCLAGNGYTPCVYDIFATAARNAASADSLQLASSVSSLGNDASIAILMLPNSSIVRSVCVDSDGLASAMKPGSIILDMSSSNPVETRKLGKELAKRHLTLLDAPVSGGVRKAISGTLAIMLGGDNETALTTVLPILETMGTVYRAGSLGAGHATKALNNYVSAAGLTAACEALLIGREFGLDPQRMTDIFNASTGRNNSTENKISQFILSGDFKSAGFNLELIAKDLSLAEGLSRQSGTPLPGVAATAQLWRQANEALESGADHTEIFRYIESLTQ